MLKNIRIVLVETSHTGNIGSVARAMKTMGLSELWLVNPLIKPDSQAISLAAGASDIIESATITSTLEKALMGCHLVVGSSARMRNLSSKILTPKELGIKIIDTAKTAPTALVFGRERIGLTNEELQKCSFHTIIPANPTYSSLNLAMAVQILAYEIYQAYQQNQQLPIRQLTSQIDHYPANEELELFYQHLEQILLNVGFLKAQHPGKILSKLRRLFTRSRVEKQELNILRGILASISKKIDQ